MKKIFQSLKGTTLIELVVSIAIISLLFTGMYQMMSYSNKLTLDNKLRLAATMIADQKMEIVRSLPYIDVGVLSGGTVSGTLNKNETINNNNGSFDVEINVISIDDLYDGTGLSDGIPNDYKQVRISVSWDGPFGTKNVTVFTKVAPKGVETLAGGGYLIIKTINSEGVDVALANINLLSPGLSINENNQTDNSGNLIYPGIAIANDYSVTATKAGYNTESVNTTVLASQITNVTITINPLSNLNITAYKIVPPASWRIGDGDSLGKNQENARVVFDTPGNAYVVWQDDRVNKPKVYCQKYDSAGIQLWSDDKVVATAEDTILPDVKISNDEQFLLLGWGDDAVGNKEAYLHAIKTVDGDDYWGGEKKVNTLASNEDQTRPRISLFEDAGGSKVTIAFEDNRDGTLDVYFRQYNLSDGTDITGNEMLAPTVSAGNQSAPVVINDSLGNTYIAWGDTRNTNSDIYMAKFDSSNARAWEKKMTNNSPDANQSEPSLAIDSTDQIYLAWTDDRNDIGNNSDIYMQKFDTDGNEIWTGADLKLNTTSDASIQKDASVTIDADNLVFATWSDSRNGNFDIYAQKIALDGSKAWSADLKVNISATDSNETNSEVVINPSVNRPFATWQTDAAGDTDMDIMVGDLTNYIETRALISAINLIITSASYNQTLATDANGKINLVNIIGGIYAVAPDSSSGYTLLYTDPNTIDVPHGATLGADIYLKN